MRKSFIILGALSVVFLGVYIWSALPLNSGTEIGPRFDWPDETANHFWTVKYAKTGHLVVPEPLNELAKNQIHPRSFNVRPDGALVPGSFLGLIIIYGTLAKLFSTSAIILFTPILSVLAVWAFYFIVKEFFNERVALMAAILMFFHPAWWYYSVTTMLPNVAFVAFLLFSFYFLLRHRTTKIQPDSLLLAALFGGLAISIRPSEIIWMAAVYLALFYYLQNRLDWKKIIIFVAIGGVVVLPVIFQQQSIYGSYLSSGYAQLNDATADACSSCNIVKSIIAPFGVHPSLVAKNFWLHFVSRMWWLSLLTILGFVAYVASPRVQSAKSFGFMMVSFFVFGWLAIYYGSWEFSDELTVHLNTLGLSYVRYWLPLYLLSLPFMALGIIWLTTFFKNRVKHFATTILLLLLLAVSANLVLYEKPDSIVPVKHRIAEYKKNSTLVNSLTEETSVIVTVRKDKLFFPDRKVIHTFDALSLNAELQTIVANLNNLVPVYYYALGPEPTLELNHGLRLELVSNVGQEILYKVIK